jgi:hypothetical protein
VETQAARHRCVRPRSTPVFGLQSARQGRSCKVKFADYLPRWVAGCNHEAATTFRDQGIMRNHIVPRWGPVPLAKIDYTSVQGWIAELSAKLSPATVRQQRSRSTTPALDVLAKRAGILT